jgi:hypothetical protein
MTTLKVDWSGGRIRAVYEVLEWPRPFEASRRVLRGEFEPWTVLTPDDGATIKLAVSRTVLDDFERILGTALGRVAAMIVRARDNAPDTLPYEDCVALQTHLWAALRDVQGYRAAVAGRVSIRLGVTIPGECPEGHPPSSPLS